MCTFNLLFTVLYGAKIASKNLLKFCFHKDIKFKQNLWKEHMWDRQRICIIYRRQSENKKFMRHKKLLKRIERQLCAFKVSDLLLCATSESYTILRNMWFLKTELSQVPPPPLPLSIYCGVVQGVEMST